MKLGYAKLGRSFPVRYFKSSSLGGDQAVIRLLDYLRADHELHLVGPNQGVEDERSYGYVPENTVNHWREGAAFGNVETVPNESRSPDTAPYRKFLADLEAGVERLPKLDAYVIWLGQHSSVSSFIPSVRKDDGHVTPLMSQINYVYPILHLLNKRGIKPIWLHPDARNTLKCRDLIHTGQRQILSQYDREHEIQSWHPTEGIRESQTSYRYSGIDLLVLPPESVDRPDFERHLLRPPGLQFGALINEGLREKVNWTALVPLFLERFPLGSTVTMLDLDPWFREHAPKVMKAPCGAEKGWRLQIRSCIRHLYDAASEGQLGDEGYILQEIVRGSTFKVTPVTQVQQKTKYSTDKSRLKFVRTWFYEVEREFGYELVGHWEPDSQWMLNRKITPVPNTQVRQQLRKWRSTMTFPPTGDTHSDAWVGAKQWECFSAGVVCFRPEGLVDTQGHAYGGDMPEELRTFLTVPSPRELMERVRLLENDDFYRRVARTQFDYFERVMKLYNNGRREVDRAIEAMAMEGAK